MKNSGHVLSVLIRIAALALAGILIVVVTVEMVSKKIKEEFIPEMAKATSWRTTVVIKEPNEPETVREVWRGPLFKIKSPLMVIQKSDPVVIEKKPESPPFVFRKPLVDISGPLLVFQAVIPAETKPESVAKEEPMLIAPESRIVAPYTILSRQLVSGELAFIITFSRGSASDVVAALDKLASEGWNVYEGLVLPQKYRQKGEVALETIIVYPKKREPEKRIPSPVERKKDSCSFW